MSGENLSGLGRNIATAVIPGGAAGDHSVPGNIRDGDDLISVRHVSADLTTTNADLTSEFSIKSSAFGVINNAAGTATTGDFLIVTWSPATR